MPGFNKQHGRNVMDQVMKKWSPQVNPQPIQKPKKPRQHLEKDIQSAISQYLRAKKIFHWRNNTGAVKTNNRMISFGKKGSSDIFALHQGRFYAIEVKSPKGEHRSSQKQFQSDVEVSGGIYILARSVDDVINHLK